MDTKLFDLSKLHESLPDVVPETQKTLNSKSTNNNNNDLCQSKENKLLNEITASFSNLPFSDHKPNNRRRLSLDIPSKQEKIMINAINSVTVNPNLVRRRHSSTIVESSSKQSPSLKEHRLDLSSSNEIKNGIDNASNIALRKYPVFINGSPRRIKFISKKKNPSTALKNDVMTGIFQIPVKKIIEENLTVSLLKSQLKRTLSSCLQSPPVKRLASASNIDADLEQELLHFSPISTKDILLLEDESKLQSLTYLNTIKNGRRIAKIIKTKYEVIQTFNNEDICKEASKVRWCDNVDSNESSLLNNESTSQINNLELNDCDKKCDIDNNNIKSGDDNVNSDSSSSDAAHTNGCKEIRPILNLNKLAEKWYPLQSIDSAINIVVTQSRRRSSTFLAFASVM